MLFCVLNTYCCDYFNVKPHCPCMSYCAVWFNSGPFKNLPAFPFYWAVTPCNVCCLTCLKWLLVSLTNYSNSKHVVLHFPVVKWGIELNKGFSCALF